MKQSTLLFTMMAACLLAMTGCISVHHEGVIPPSETTTVIKK